MIIFTEKEWKVSGFDQKELKQLTAKPGVSIGGVSILKAAKQLGYRYQHEYSHHKDDDGNSFWIHQSTKRL